MITGIYNSSEGPIEIAAMHPGRVIKAHAKLVRDFDPARAEEILALQQEADRNAVAWFKANPGDKAAQDAAVHAFVRAGLGATEAALAALHIVGASS